MGTSNNAILVLGVDFGEERPEWMKEEQDFDDLVLSMAGYVPLDDDEMDIHLIMDDHSKRQAIMNACPVEEVLHCFDEYPMTILAVRNTQIKAFRGSPGTVEPAHLTSVSSERVQAFKDWLLERGMTSEEVKPSWLLCSMNTRCC